MRIVGLIAALAATGGLYPQRARACQTEEPEVYAIDPSLRVSDTTPPTPFTAIRAEVTRTPATLCNDDECFSSSCGALGTVTLEFTRPRDERDEQVGYRLVWLDGRLATNITRELHLVRPLASPPDASGEGLMMITIGFDEAAVIDGTIALVAIDRAGNESAPSEPVHLTFSGCTRALDDDGCLETPDCGVARPGGGTRGNAGLIACGLVALAGLWLRRVRTR